MTSQTQQQGHSIRQTATHKLTKGKQYLQVFGEIDRSLLKLGPISCLKLGEEQKKVFPQIWSHFFAQSQGRIMGRDGAMFLCICWNCTFSLLPVRKHQVL